MRLRSVHSKLPGTGGLFNPRIRRWPTRTRRRWAHAAAVNCSGARRERARAAEEMKYSGVEYWEDMDAARRAAISTSPALRACVRHRRMEQAQPAGETEEGVAVGMEPTERALVDVAATKRVAAIVLAIEQRYGADAVYAVDGSADEAARALRREGLKVMQWRPLLLARLRASCFSSRNSDGTPTV